MAPEVTRMTSCPRPLRSDSTRTRCSIFRKLVAPDSWVRVEVPTFTTTRCFCCSNWLILLWKKLPSTSGAKALPGTALISIV